MLTSFVVVALVGGQNFGPPIKIPRTPFKVASYPGAHLLSWPLIQEELGVSSAIVSGIDQSREAYYKHLEGQRVPSASPKPMRNMLSPAMSNALEQISPAQKKRLGEIYVQYYDVTALADPYVAKLVGLSPSQQQFVGIRLTEAHQKHQAAQEAMFESFRQHGIALEKAGRSAQPPVEEIGPNKLRIVRHPSIPMPREMQYRQVDLTRRTQLLLTSEMTRARADIRKQLLPAQLAKVEKLKGRRLPYAFYYYGSSPGSPHPTLVLNVQVQGELGFTVKEHLAIRSERADESAVAKRVISRLSAKQLATLRGFELQYDREFSILRQDIADELGLTPATLDLVILRLQEIETEAQRKRDDEWVKKETENRRDEVVGKNQESIMRAADEAKRKTILYFLSASQRAKWNAMLGKPMPDIVPTHIFG